jgi:NAD+ diphosphatase
MDHWFVGAVEPPEPGADADEQVAWWFAFRGDELLVTVEQEAAVVPRLAESHDLKPYVHREVYLGRLEGVGSWAVELSRELEPPPGMSLHGLRSLFGLLDERLFAVAGRAAQVIAWDRDHQFCGRCGTATERVQGERARRCPACRLLAFPRLSPAIIVLIERDERVLMARGRGMPRDRFGIVAGFVEPGESLEEAVRREVWEEVGLEIAEVRYFGSQAWPFPHAVMIGFTAQHAAGEIELRDGELTVADWFALDALPTVPSKMSIARRLLDAWASRRGGVIEQP